MSHRTNHSGRGGRIESLEPRRLLAIPGSLDPSFSGDGKATIFLTSIETVSANDVAVQADGKSVVVGVGHNTFSGERFFVTARFNVDGTPDSGFGTGGFVRTQLSDLGNSEATAVAIAPEGKILVVGNADVSGGLDEQELAAARYNTDGSLDNTFDANGVLSRDLSGLNLPTEVVDVAIQPGGRIVIVGDAGDGSILSDTDFFAAYYSTNGTFSGVTRVAFGFGQGDAASAVRLDNAGRIFIAGSNFDGDVRSAALTRLTSFVLPPEFGGGTSATVDFKTRFALPGRTRTTAEDLFVQPDGKIIVAGDTLSVDGLHDFFVARFTADGVLDTTFGTTGPGFTVTDVGGDDRVGGITATPALGVGGFIVSGNSSGMAAVKYTDNGALDTSFGTGGKVRLFFGGAASIAPWFGRRVVLAGGAGFATARVLLANARIVTAGVADNLAVEGTTNTGSLFVGRTENLPFETRVFFGVSGTASISTSRTGGSRDYVMTGMTISPTTLTSGTGVVIIPAGQTFLTIPLSTLNDSLRETTETANFTVLSNSIYEIGSPSSATISIRDDDTSNLSIGTTTVDAPPKHVGVGQEVQAAVTWTVPEGGWRQLSTIQLRLRDRKDDDALAILSFDEATNSFSIESTPGAENLVTLVPEKSTFQAVGPTAPTVTIIFTFVFNASAANTRLRLDVGATNDGEDFSGFEEIGELHVHKKPNGDALALPL